MRYMHDTSSTSDVTFHVELVDNLEHIFGGYLDYKENITNKQAAFRLYTSL